MVLVSLDCWFSKFVFKYGMEVTDPVFLLFVCSQSYSGILPVHKLVTNQPYEGLAFGMQHAQWLDLSSDIRTRPLEYGSALYQRWTWSQRTRRSMPTCDDKGVFTDDDDTHRKHKQATRRWAGGSQDKGCAGPDVVVIWT
jgi:hypothetical protein